MTVEEQWFLVVVLPTANRVTCSTECPENESNNQDNHSNGPQNRDRQYKSDEKKNQSKNNHHCPTFLKRITSHFLKRIISLFLKRMIRST
jgi:hypothetical protein